MPLRLGKAGKATAFNELGRQRDEEGDQDGALAAYAQASAIHPAPNRAARLPLRAAGRTALLTGAMLGKS